ncbi:TIGR02281 family clan AA aspartic protease [Parvularcula sp. LCG005]|uniref:retropepsin-like aspartic protease family protein n=1 Tax=Parvularcula sp. LCG005 TaxID=3078805 RepID=UPI002942959F|nr:TIGR02281 family clan AA aspartic protease [Parvularcula sp. LCG005]WOI53388.1 TIGR02281 family clan AA aspartic protease [Parvularcula sp. LCG005]
MGNNYGLIAVGVLALFLIVMGFRATDDEGRFTVGATSGIDAPKVVRTTGGTEEILIRRSMNGSFLTEARFDGTRINVLVDTGATTTVLRESDANRVGIRPGRWAFTHSVSTANGTIMAARDTVRDVEIGYAYFGDVGIMILPDDKLDISLLGMNVISQFDRVEMTAEGLRLTLDR